MKYEKRLYVWVKMMDDAGNYVRNTQDVSSVLLKTQETVWTIPEEIDYALAENKSSVTEMVFQKETFDIEVQDVEFDILKFDDSLNLQDVIAGLQKRFKSDKKRTIRIEYVDPSTDYTHYDIKANTLTSLLETFISVNINTHGKTVEIPQKILSVPECDLILKSCEIVTPRNPVLTLKSFESRSCSFRTKEEESLVAIVVETGLVIQQTTIYSGVLFSFQSKSSTQSVWEKCTADLIQSTIFESTGDRIATVFTFLNFNNVNVSYLLSGVTNPKRILVSCSECNIVGVNNLVQAKEISREVPLVMLNEVNEFRADATIDSSFGSVAYSFFSSNRCSVRITDTTLISGGLIRILAEHMDKLIITGVVGSNKNPIESRLLSAKEILISGVELDVSFLDGKDIDSLKIANSTVTGDIITMNRIKSFRVDNSEVLISGLVLSLGDGGRLDFTNSAFNSDIVANGFVNDKGERTSQVSFGALCRFKGRVILTAMKRSAFERIKVESSKFSVESTQIGSSYMDVVTESCQSLEIKASSLTTFQPSIFRSKSPFSLVVDGVATGSYIVSLRDMSNGNESNSQKLSLHIKNSKSVFTIAEEGIVNKGSVNVISDNSIGSRIIRNSEKVLSLIDLLLDVSSQDFSKFRSIKTFSGDYNQFVMYN